MKKPDGDDKHIRKLDKRIKNMEGIMLKLVQQSESPKVVVEQSVAVDASEAKPPEDVVKPVGKHPEGISKLEPRRWHGKSKDRVSRGEVELQPAPQEEKEVRTPDVVAAFNSPPLDVRSSGRGTPDPIAESDSYRDTFLGSRSGRTPPTDEAVRESTLTQDALRQARKPKPVGESAELENMSREKDYMKVSSPTTSSPGSSMTSWDLSVTLSKEQGVQAREPDRFERRVARYLKPVEEAIRDILSKGRKPEVLVREVKDTDEDDGEQADVCAVSKPKAEKAIDPRVLAQAGMIGGDENWVKVKGGITLDSGSCVDIAPNKYLPQFPTKPRSETESKKKYIAANGSPIPCYGNKAIKFRTPDGGKQKWEFVAGDVNKILKSVSKTCDAGNGLWFDTEGGFIIELNADFVKKLSALLATSKTKIPFSRVGDTYKLEAWVRRPMETATNQQVFTRQVV